MNNTPSTTSSARDFDYGDTRRRTDYVSVCACHLYDAECALHAAHQSHVEEWIAAASLKLHYAVGEYLAAIAAHHDDRPPRAGSSAESDQ